MNYMYVCRMYHCMLRFIFQSSSLIPLAWLYVYVIIILLVIYTMLFVEMLMHASLFSVPGDDNQMLLRQWESVLREGTATPSESQGGGVAGGKGSGEGVTGQKSGGGDGTTPENQHDANSEPEAPNDSSAEEESG